MLSAETATLLYVIGAWFVYAILGFLANTIDPKNPEEAKFDAAKLGRSLVWAIVVVLIAVGLKITPTAVIAGYDNLVTMLVAVIANSGFGIAMIYALDKAYRIVTGYFDKFQLKST